MPFVERNILKAHMGSGTLEHDAGITSQAKEGFERTHLPEKIQFYNIARGSTGEVRSAALRNFRQLPTISARGRTPEKHRNFSWKACLGSFAVDRGTQRQIPTSFVASARPNLLSASLYLPMTR